jgi:hypothetical protein
MGWSLFAGVLLVAACGRFDFDPQPAQPGPGEAVLRCGAPERFTIGAELRSLNAVATPLGFAIVGVDSAQDLRGWTYEWADSLAPAAQDVPLDADVTTTTGLEVLGEEIVVASIYGGMTPIGTRLHRLDPDLASLAPASSLVGVMAGEGPISRGGGDAPDLALVSVDPTSRVDVRRIDTAGASLMSPQIAVDSAEVASSVRLSPARDGYLLSWTSAAGSPNKKRLALLDRNLDLVIGPVSAASGANENAIRGAVAWLPDADRYLIAWFEKVGAGGDAVWYQIFDGKLDPVMPATQLAEGGVLPQLGTDGSHFFVAWKDVAATPDALVAAVIAPDGEATLREVSSSGGSPLGFGFVERNGQSVLVWSETGGSGPDLWLDPMCP